MSKAVSYLNKTVPYDIKVINANLHTEITVSKKENKKNKTIYYKKAAN